MGTQQTQKQSGAGSAWIPGGYFMLKPISWLPVSMDAK